MTAAALDALRREREHVLALARSLHPQEWDQPSDCAGWRVQDVVAHMAATFRSLAAPGTVATAGSTDAEVNADAAVDERRGRTPAEVLAEYEEWSTTCIDGALSGMQSEPTASTVVPMGNLGSHPLHILANALVFDHYCHLRHDLLAPGGPLERPALPQEPDTLAAIVEWMLGGLPQMCAEALTVLDRPLVLTFPDLQASWILEPPTAAGGLVAVVPGDASAAAARVTGSAHDFVSWGTKRRDWRSFDVQVHGDAAYAATVLDAVNVI